MRVPLVRFGDDERPFAWWELLFIPVMLPLIFISLLVLAVLSVPAEVVYGLRQRRREKELRPRLAAVGRVMDWAEVETKLVVGDGTLVVEHCSPKGPVREWWTADDLVAAAPVTLPTSIRAPAEDGLTQLQDYAASCAVRYLDHDAGSACLTDVSVPLHQKPAKYIVVHLGGGMMTAIVLRTGRDLAGKYPRGRVVTLVAWTDKRVLFAGDAETVFLGDPA